MLDKLITIIAVTCLLGITGLVITNRFIEKTKCECGEHGK